MLKRFNFTKGVLFVFALASLVWMAGCSSDSPTAPSSEPEECPTNILELKSNDAQITCKSEAKKHLPGGMMMPTGVFGTLTPVTDDINKLICTIKWQDNSQVELGFTIERRVGLEGPWQVIGQTITDDSKFQDLHFNRNKIYFYRVQAFNSISRSAYSFPIRVSSPMFIDPKTVS